MRLLSLALACALLATSATAREAALRTPFGAPDLGGVWSNNSLTTLLRPPEFKSLRVTEEAAAAYEKTRLGKPPMDPDDPVGGVESEWWETDVGLARIGGAARSSWLVAPENGRLPYTAAAREMRKARRERFKTDYSHPEIRTLGERCLSTEASGPPLMNGGYNDNYEIVQTPSEVLIVAEYMHDVRIVRLGPDARHPPAHVRRWNGDSIGRWEGDTLVIETTNFTPAEVDAPNGDPKADMRVIERLRRSGRGELHYVFRVENPAVFIVPWQGEMTFRPGGRIYEFACHEGNYSLGNILAGGRAQDGAPTPASP